MLSGPRCTAGASGTEGSCGQGCRLVRGGTGVPTAQCSWRQASCLGGGLRFNSRAHPVVLFPPRHTWGVRRSSGEPGWLPLLTWERKVLLAGGLPASLCMQA